MKWLAVAFQALLVLAAANRALDENHVGAGLLGSLAAMAAASLTIYVLLRKPKAQV